MTSLLDELVDALLRVLTFVIVLLGGLAILGIILSAKHAKAENLALDTSLARAFAAMVVDVPPPTAAWVLEDRGDLTIFDDAGTILLQGTIPDGAWDGAMLMLSPPGYTLNDFIAAFSGDNPWKVPLPPPEKPRLWLAAAGWQERVGALWQERLSKIADKDQSDGNPVAKMEEWFGRQYNRKGGFCCSKADAYPFDGDYQFTPAGGVTFQWVDKDGNPFAVIVPRENLVQPPVDGDGKLIDPNPTGGAVIWYTGVLNEGINPNLICFEPGQLG